MENADKKIVVLADYVRARGRLNIKDIQEILNEQAMHLRSIEDQAVDLVNRKHKLRDTDLINENLVRLTGNLIKIKNWIKDEINHANGNVDEKITDAQKQREELASGVEAIKKLISDDLSSRRYIAGREALNPMQVAGFLLGTPMAIKKFIEDVVTDKPEALSLAGKVGLALGAYLAFYRQINRLTLVSGTMVINSPNHIPTLKRKIRHSSAALALTASVASKSKMDISPRFPSQNTTGPRIVISASL